MAERWLTRARRSIYGLGEMLLRPSTATGPKPDEDDDGSSRLQRSQSSAARIRENGRRVAMGINSEESDLGKLAERDEDIGEGEEEDNSFDAHVSGPIGRKAPATPRQRAATYDPSVGGTSAASLKRSKQRSAAASGLPCTRSTSIEQLASQGATATSDGSAAYWHFSTSPSNYYLAAYQIEGGVNMDRGGFGHASDGTNFACVFDGVTAGGVVNAYAAQAFTDHTLHWLGENQHLFRNGEGINEALARSVFTRACDASQNPAHRRPEWDAECGSATAALVTFEPRGRQSKKNRKRFMPSRQGKTQDQDPLAQPTCNSAAHTCEYAVLNGASIGDAAVLVVHTDSDGQSHARVLNHVRRLGKRDNGGQLTMCLGIDGDVWSFSEPVERDALVILTTDGFVDNFLAADIPHLVPLIIKSSLFDERVTVECPVVIGADAHLPGLGRLQDITTGTLCAMSDVTCTQACARLCNYLEWITRPLAALEQEYFATQHAYDTTRRHKTPDTEQLAKLDDKLKDMRERRADGAAAKTDDAMVIVLRPFHARCEQCPTPQPQQQP